jgi:guanylate kinase
MSTTSIHTEINAPKLLVFAAPSGAGKTTIVKHLLQKFPQQLAFSVSATTRPIRAGEMDGKDYYFIDVNDFRTKISNGDFLEYEEVYEGRLYGTLFSEIDRLTKEGKAVLFDIDVVGATNIKKKFGNSALLVFVKPPTIEALVERLKNRLTETEEEIQKRTAKMEYELSFETQFDKTLINDKLETAFIDAENIVSEFLYSGN